MRLQLYAIIFVGLFLLSSCASSPALPINTNPSAKALSEKHSDESDDIFVDRSTPPGFEAIKLQKLKVTSGKISENPDGLLMISSPNPRAVTSTGSPQQAVLRFRYLGPSEKTRKLASGLLRRQIGLKLEAEDSCNLIYIMYRISSSPALSVQLKRNSGMHAHSQCGNKGYSSLLEKPLPAVKENTTHEIAFERDGAKLNITIDGVIEASLVLPPEALELHGAIGLRSDNGNFEVELLTGTLPDAHK